MISLVFGTLQLRHVSYGTIVRNRRLTAPSGRMVVIGMREKVLLKWDSKY